MDEIFCSICKKLIYEPKQCASTRCDALFCGACADDWFGKRGMACPGCKSETKFKNVGRSLKKMIDRVMISCECGRTVQYGELKDCITNYMQKTMRCPLGCGHELSSKEERDAHLKVCPKALM